MGTSVGNAFVIAWAQTQLDGYPAGYDTTLMAGMTWRWEGQALSLDLDCSAPDPGLATDQNALRKRAAQVVRKMLQQPRQSPQEHAADDLDPILRGAFVVTDGVDFFTVIPIVMDDGVPPVLLFADCVPPPNRELTIVHCSE
ncbi:MAG: hemolysin-type calcium-binding protein, partial [Octadecabacter sp.]|nr:hemolysin-type calcium-binding protein [Octadecabacter sp.]